MTNADALLLPIITHLEKRIQSTEQTVFIELQILLLDTQSGKLIWGNSAAGKATGVLGTSTVSPWQVLIPELLSGKFWTGFPGKIIVEKI